MIEIMFTSIFLRQEGIRDMRTCVTETRNESTRSSIETRVNKGRTATDIQASMVTNIGII